MSGEQIGGWNGDLVGQEWRGALRASAHRSGRDNDPGGLGDMPDSQGPNMAGKPIGTGVLGALFPARRLFPVAQILGREMFNGCIYQICSLGISLPQVIPPTYVGS